MAGKSFASSADLGVKEQTLEVLADGVYALTAEGDPNLGAIEGEDFLVCFEALATPVAARRWLSRLREHTDKPVRYLVLSHYHAVRVLGASAFDAEVVVSSEQTRGLIAERGQQDWESEFGRMPRLFEEPESIPGLTWPTMTFTGKMTLWLGKLEVQLLQLGRGHTKGDTVVWLPGEGALLSGDLVEFGATPYAGDAYFKDWPKTLENLAALQPKALVPGRGAALTTPEEVARGLTETREFISDVYANVQKGVAAGKDLNAVYKDTFAAMKPKYGHWVIFDHCMPFDVTRCYDEATEFADPRIWTAERDIQMWKTLEG